MTQDTEVNNYEQNWSHYHCWDTNKFDGDDTGDINGQEGHEKHLACCLCGKHSEVKDITRSDTCKVGIHKACAMSNCKCECHTEVKNGCEKCIIPSAGFQTYHKIDCDCICHAEVNTSSDLVEDVVQSFWRMWGTPNFRQMTAIEPFLRTTLTSLIARVREEENDCTCKEKWAVGVVHLKDSPCYWHAKHDAQRDSYKEGRMEALDEVEEKMKVVEKSYLIQDSSKDSEIIKASHNSRTWTFQTVLSIIADLKKK